MIAAALTAISLATYAIVPLLIGGASAEERRLIEAAWEAEVISVLEGGDLPVEAWEGSDLQAAALARDPDDLEGFFRAIGSGVSCPVPTGSTAALEFSLCAGGSLIDRRYEEVLGLLRLTRRMAQHAPDLFTLVVAVMEGDEALAFARAHFAFESADPTSALAGFSAPDPEEVRRAFCRELVALQAELGAPEAGEDSLDMMILGFKVASLHEARRLQEALARRARQVDPTVDRPIRRSPPWLREALDDESRWEDPAAPGRLAVWRAMWLQRPAELSEVVFLPLIASNISGVVSQWQRHLTNWESALDGH